MDELPEAMSGDCTPSLADELIAAEAELDAFHSWCSDWEEPLTRQDDAVLERARTAMSRAAVAVRERDALEQWKREATAVIERWERVYEALDSPGGLGQFRSDLAFAEVLLRKAERDVLAARVEQLEAELTREGNGTLAEIDRTIYGVEHGIKDVSRLANAAARLRAALEADPVPEPRPATDPEQRIREVLTGGHQLVLGDWEEHTRSALGGYNGLTVTARSTLAHLHGHHDDSDLPYAHCVICEAFRASTPAPEPPAEQPKVCPRCESDDPAILHMPCLPAVPGPDPFHTPPEPGETR